MNITGKTKIIGIYGNPIEHSLSPLMHNKAFQALNLDYAYIPFNIKKENLKDAINSIRTLGLVGLNITIPHKEAVITSLDEVSNEARLIGAVNTIVNDNGKLIGYNTDGAGFYQSLIKLTGEIPKNKKIFIIGTGGASRAVAFQLALEEAGKLILTNRNYQKGYQLAEELANNTKSNIEMVEFKSSKIEDIIPKVDIIINTTPIGMYPNVNDDPIIAPELISPNTIVCDLIYNPYKTLLLRKAEDKGCKVVPGIGMLLYQGVLGFEKWTGVKAPVEIMEKVLIDFLFNKLPR